MNKILVNTSTVLSLLVISFSSPVHAMLEPEESENTASESQRVKAPLSQQPAINGSVVLGSGAYNPEINAIMNAMQVGGYTVTLVDFSPLTESQHNAAVYFMNPPQGN